MFNNINYGLRRDRPCIAPLKTRAFGMNRHRRDSRWPIDLESILPCRARAEEISRGRAVQHGLLIICRREGVGIIQRDNRSPDDSAFVINPGGPTPPTIKDTKYVASADILGPGK